jgi:hypothetical protein
MAETIQGHSATVAANPRTGELDVIDCKTGNSMLHLAAYADLSPHNLKLIKVGRAQLAPNKQGDTPLSIALQRHNNGIVDKIIEFCREA